MAKKISALPPVTDLTPVERAKHVLLFDKRKEQLTELAQSTQRIVGIKNAAGYQECHSARMTLKNTRVDIEKAGKTAREDATAFSKAVINAEKDLIGVISPEETRLQKIQDAWDAEREAERAEKARKESEAIAAEQAAIKKVRELPLKCVGLSADAIQKWIDATNDLDFDDIPERVREQVREIRVSVIEQLEQMAADKRAAEEAQKKLAEERAELESQKAEQAEKQKELDRQADAARKEADRLAQAERDRVADEDRKNRAAEESDRQARIAEEDRVRREADEKLQADRREFERKRREAEKVEREREIAEATLIGAAGDAVTLLQNEGFGEHLVTLKLAAALNRETKQVQEAA